MKYPDEESVGNWMVEWNNQIKIEQRVACPELGYPFSEAQYASIEDWEKATGKQWYEEFCP